MTIASAPRLAFVFGHPRSGTTLLAKLIDSHPSVLYLHEPVSKWRRQLVVHDAIAALGRGASLDDGLARRMADDFIAHRTHFLQPPFFPKDFARVRHGAAIAWFWRRMAGRAPAFLVAQASRRDPAIVLVKDGFEWFSIGLVHATRARSFILLRHPCGVVSSMLRGQTIGAMPPGDRESYWAAHRDQIVSAGFDQTDVRSMRNEEFEALRWLISSNRARDVFDDPFHKVLTYERLVREMAGTTADLFAFIGLKVGPSTTAFIGRGGSSRLDILRSLRGPGARYFALARRSEHPDAAWQDELPADARERVENVVKSFPVQRFWPA